VAVVAQQRGLGVGLVESDGAGGERGAREGADGDWRPVQHTVSSVGGGRTS
jgi:hypothetical protein